MDNKLNDEVFVSILINNYNYGAFVAEAIDSALSQTYANKEVIVVDDGSTDNSRAIIESYGSQLISIFKENGGQASTFNVGFEASKGQIICFLDADDAFMLDKLNKVVDIFRKNPAINWCFHPLQLLDVKTGQHLNHVYEGVPSSECNFTADMKRGKRNFTYPPTSGLCFTRSCLDKILPMPLEINIVSDNYIKYVSTCLYQGYFLNVDLATQKIHGQNAYTLNPNYIRLKADYAIKIAFWIQKNYPSLYEFTDCLVAQDGVFGYLRSGSYNSDSKVFLSKYFSSIGLMRKIRIYARAFYQFTKFQLKTWLGKCAS